MTLEGLQSRYRNQIVRLAEKRRAHNIGEEYTLEVFCFGSTGRKRWPGANRHGEVCARVSSLHRG